MFNFISEKSPTLAARRIARTDVPISFILDFIEV